MTIRHSQDIPACAVTGDMFDLSTFKQKYVYRWLKEVRALMG